MNDGSRRPTAETIVPGLLDAVERLCADQSPEGVGMRDIAKEAGVSLGAAYRYFDSKQALLGAALDRMAERIASAITASDDTAEAINSVWTELNANPAFPRLVTWAILNGQNVSTIMSKHPLVREVAITATARGIEDPQTVAGITALIGIAGAVYGPTINRALQRDPDDRHLYDTAANMLTHWIDRQDRQTS
jgi:AcrR family transcriptional regulator